MSGSSLDGQFLKILKTLGNETELEEVNHWAVGDILPLTVSCLVSVSCLAFKRTSELCHTLPVP